MDNKKVFITGITGMVGSTLAELILKKHNNAKIIGLTRWRSKLDNLESLSPLINKNKNIFLEYGDLNDYSSIEQIISKIKPDYIYHLAAQSFPKASFQMPIETLNTNIIGTYNLLDCINKHCNKSKIHVCSSSEVFGRVSKNELPINEKCRFHPASPYAISKVGTDLIAKYFYEAFNLNTYITRMFTHTGPRRGDYFAESTFAKQIAMIEYGYQKPEIKVGNLNSLRTVADVRDAVNAYYLLLTKKSIKPGSIFNIGGNHVCTVRDILNKLISLSNKKNIKIKHDKSRFRPIDADLQVPDTSKFQKASGWKQQYSFHQTMCDLLNYWRENINKNGKVYINR